jgi:hypothetical protein
MKLINIEIEKYVFNDDVEIRVYFYKWNIATFRYDSLSGQIIRK